MNIGEHDKGYDDTSDTLSLGRELATFDNPEAAEQFALERSGAEVVVRNNDGSFSVYDLQSSRAGKQIEASDFEGNTSHFQHGLAETLGGTHAFVATDDDHIMAVAGDTAVDTGHIDYEIIRMDVDVRAEDYNGIGDLGTNDQVVTVNGQVDIDFMARGEELLNQQLPAGVRADISYDANTTMYTVTFQGDVSSLTQATIGTDTGGSVTIASVEISAAALTLPATGVSRGLDLAVQMNDGVNQQVHSALEQIFSGDSLAGELSEQLGKLTSDMATGLVYGSKAGTIRYLAQTMESKGLAVDPLLLHMDPMNLSPAERTAIDQFTGQTGLTFDYNNQGVISVNIDSRLELSSDRTGTIPTPMVERSDQVHLHTTGRVGSLSSSARTTMDAELHVSEDEAEGVRETIDGMYNTYTIDADAIENLGDMSPDIQAFLQASEGLTFNTEQAFRDYIRGASLGAAGQTPFTISDQEVLDILHETDQPYDVTASGDLHIVGTNTTEVRTSALASGAVNLDPSQIFADTFSSNSTFAVSGNNVVISPESLGYSLTMSQLQAGGAAGVEFTEHENSFVISSQAAFDASGSIQSHESGETIASFDGFQVQGSVTYDDQGSHSGIHVEGQATLRQGNFGEYQAQGLQISGQLDYGDLGALQLQGVGADFSASGTVVNGNTAYIMHDIQGEGEGTHRVAFNGDGSLTEVEASGHIHFEKQTDGETDFAIDANASIHFQQRLDGTIQITGSGMINELQLGDTLIEDLNIPAGATLTYDPASGQISVEASAGRELSIDARIDGEPFRIQGEVGASLTINGTATADGVDLTIIPTGQIESMQYGTSRIDDFTIGGGQIGLSVDNDSTHLSFAPISEDQPFEIQGTLVEINSPEDDIDPLPDAVQPISLRATGTVNLDITEQEGEVVYELSSDAMIEQAVLGPNGIAALSIEGKIQVTSDGQMSVAGNNPDEPFRVSGYLVEYDQDLFGTVDTSNVQITGPRDPVTGLPAPNLVVEASGHLNITPEDGDSNGYTFSGSADLTQLRYQDTLVSDAHISGRLRIASESVEVDDPDNPGQTIEQQRNIVEVSAGVDEEGNLEGNAVISGTINSGGYELVLDDLEVSGSVIMQDGDVTLEDVEVTADARIQGIPLHFVAGADGRLSEGLDLRLEAGIGSAITLSDSGIRLASVPLEDEQGQVRRDHSGSPLSGIQITVDQIGLSTGEETDTVGSLLTHMSSVEAYAQQADELQGMVGYLKEGQLSGELGAVTLLIDPHAESLHLDAQMTLQANDAEGTWSSNDYQLSLSQLGSNRGELRAAGIHGGTISSLRSAVREGNREVRIETGMGLSVIDGLMRPMFNQSLPFNSEEELLTFLTDQAGITIVSNGDDRAGQEGILTEEQFELLAARSQPFTAGFSGDMVADISLEASANGASITMSDGRLSGSVEEFPHLLTQAIPEITSRGLAGPVGRAKLNVNDRGQLKIGGLNFDVQVTEDGQLALEPRGLAKPLGALANPLGLGTRSLAFATLDSMLDSADYYQALEEFMESPEAEGLEGRALTRELREVGLDSLESYNEAQGERFGLSAGRYARSEGSVTFENGRILIDPQVLMQESFGMTGMDFEISSLTETGSVFTTIDEQETAGFAIGFEASQSIDFRETPSLSSEQISALEESEAFPSEVLTRLDIALMEEAQSRPPELTGDPELDALPDDPNPANAIVEFASVHDFRSFLIAHDITVGPEGEADLTPEQFEELYEVIAGPSYASQGADILRAGDEGLDSFFENADAPEQLHDVFDPEDEVIPMDSDQVEYIQQVGADTRAHEQSTGESVEALDELVSDPDNP